MSSSKASSPTHGAVLKCLKGEGLEAEDQTNSSGKKIGIDYPEAESAKGSIEGCL